MFFKQLKVGFMDNFIYFVGDTKTKIAALVDPAWEESKLSKIAKENNFGIKIILLTHSHPDHIEAVSRIAAKKDVKVYIYKNDFDSLKNIDLNIVEIEDNSIIKIGNLKAKVIFTPGHTPGSVCYLIENKLFTGDTLFVGAIGRVDLAGGNADDMFESLQKLKMLNDKTEIYPGHDYGDKQSSTIGYEKRHNPYMSCKNREEFFELKSG